MDRKIAVPAVLALAVAAVLGCDQPQDKIDQNNLKKIPDNAFQCVISEDRTQNSLTLPLPIGFLLETGIAMDRTTAVEVDPDSGGRTYTATIIDSVHVSAGPRKLFERLRPGLDGVAADFDAHLDQEVGVGFVYRRARREEAERIARSVIPPAGWNKLIVRLTETAAGSATAKLGGVLGGEIGAEGHVRADLTIEDNGQYSITRSWLGSIKTEAELWIRERVGAPVDPSWSGEMETEYTTVFGPDGRLRLLTTTGTIRLNSQIHKTVRRLDLTEREDRRTTERALPGGGVGNAYSAGQVFFLNRNSTLWARLMAGPVIRSDYEDKGISHLGLGLYGLAFSHEHTLRQATRIEVTDPGGTRRVICTGKADRPDAAGAPAAEPIPEERVPQPQRKPPASP